MYSHSKLGVIRREEGQNPHEWREPCALEWAWHTGSEREKKNPVPAEGYGV